jgi:hypothetical protein
MRDVPIQTARLRECQRGGYHSRRFRDSRMKGSR